MIMLYGAPPDGDGSNRMNHLRQLLTEMEETTTASQIGKLHARRRILRERIAAAEAAHSELELVEKMLLAAGERLEL